MPRASRQRVFYFLKRSQRQIPATTYFPAASTKIVKYIYNRSAEFCLRIYFCFKSVLTDLPTAKKLETFYNKLGTHEAWQEIVNQILDSLKAGTTDDYFFGFFYFYLFTCFALPSFMNRSEMNAWSALLLKLSLFLYASLQPVSLHSFVDLVNSH